MDHAWQGKTEVEREREAREKGKENGKVYSIGWRIGADASNEAAADVRHLSAHLFELPSSF